MFSEDQGKESDASMKLLESKKKICTSFVHKLSPLKLQKVKIWISAFIRNYRARLQITVFKEMIPMATFNQELQNLFIAEIHLIRNCITYSLMRQRESYRITLGLAGLCRMNSQINPNKIMISTFLQSRISTPLWRTRGRYKPIRSAHRNPRSQPSKGNSSKAEGARQDQRQGSESLKRFKRL